VMTWWWLGEEVEEKEDDGDDFCWERMVVWVVGSVSNLDVHVGDGAGPPTWWLDDSRKKKNEMLVVE
jgi:hypothetical protein